MYKSILETDLPLTFVAIFVVVLVLFGVLARTVRWFATGKTEGSRAILRRQSRLSVIDHVRLDAKRRLVLIRRDQIAHLLMIGGQTDIVIEANVVDAVLAMPRMSLESMLETPGGTTLIESDGVDWPLQPTMRPPFNLSPDIQR